MEFRGEVTFSAWESVWFLFMVISISRRSQVQYAMGHSSEVPLSMHPCVHLLSCHLKSHAEATPFQFLQSLVFLLKCKKYTPLVSSLSPYLYSSGPRLDWSGFHPSDSRGYSRMDRSLDIAVWENFSYKPDLIHLSCWQLKAHQASSWLLASSKRLNPMRSSLIFFTLAEASVLPKTAQWAGHTMSPGIPWAVSYPGRNTSRVRLEDQTVPAFSAFTIASQKHTK